MNDFLKQILALGAEIEKADSAVEIDMAINDAEIAYEKHLEQLAISGVGKSLPIKRYDIDFGGNLMAGIEIVGESISVFGSMNGYGDGIDEDRIKITER